MWWIPMLAGKEIGQRGKSGMGFGDYINYRAFGKEKGMSWGDVLNPFKGKKKQLGNLFDPFGDLGLNKPKKKKADDPNLIAGQTPEYWVEKLGLSEEEKADMIAKLSRTVGTQTAQAQNRADEINAMQNAPQATRLAAARGVAQQGQAAVQSGTENIEQYGKNLKRGAWGTVMGAMVGKEQQQMNAALRQAEIDKQMAYQNFLPMFQMLGQMIGGGGFGGQKDWTTMGGENYMTGPGSTGEPFEWWNQ